MSERKPFLLRIERETLDAMQRWANDELRSLNGQIGSQAEKVQQFAGQLEKAIDTVIAEDEDLFLLV